MQIPLEKSKTELILNDLDDIENEQELEEYLESLSLTELLEICYMQSCEISRIRNVILNSVKNNDI